MSYKFAPAFICDFFTPFYDLVIEQGGLGREFQRKILNYAKIKEGESILDIGCGSGGLLILMKTLHPGSKIVGTDPDKKILKVAKQKIVDKNLDVELVQAWGEKLPFNDASFDVVISSLTFHHLPLDAKKQALKEIYRVLKTNGRFLLADIGKPDSLFWKIKFLFDPERLLSTGEYMKDNLQGKLPTLVKEAGFDVKEVGPRHQGIQFFLAIKVGER